MARLIQGDDLTFRALAYGEKHPGTLQFLSQQFENASHALQHVGQEFFNSAREMYEQFNGEHARRLIQAAARRVGTMWQSDSIQFLSSIGQLQHAPPTMIRWVMAEPTLREMYHAQQVDGYSDYYEDVAPSDVGEQHYDYRRVMDGIVVLNEDAQDEEPEWHADSYMEDLLPDDGDLSLAQQVDILDTWQAIVAHIRHGKDDPTSRYNAQLG